mgnify:CR=1 FL=1
MKKILFSAAVLVAAATTAQAADLPRKAPVYKAPILKVYDWTGFYIGVNAGGSVGRDRTRTTIVGAGNEQTHLSPAGAIGGGQVGYNWQFRNFYNLVLGLEADIQGSGQRTNSTCILTCVAGTSAPPFQTYNQKIDWFGTARVRAGIATGPVLSYVTGGFAYGNVTTTSVANLGGGPFNINADQTRTGYTFGSGVEAQLGGNWTGKIEYLYVNLGTQRTSGAFLGTPYAAASRIQDHIFRAGVNYGFGNNAGYVEPLRNWNGFYIGGNAGTVIGRDRSNLRFAGFTNPQFALVPEGFSGGGQIGYNWQASAWVFGVEGDFQGSTAKDNKACIVNCVTSGTTLNQTLPWLATGRGRIGYSVGSTLFYGTAGYAYGETKTKVFTNNNSPPSYTEISRQKGGYVVGAGIESPLTFLGLFGPAWTMKTEYLYVDLGSTTSTVATGGVPYSFTTQTREHIFRGGINYNFNAPVVAKY